MPSDGKLIMSTKRKVVPAYTITNNAYYNQ